MPLLKNRIKNRIKNNFDDIELQKDFNPILSFVSEFCELPYAFVSLIGTGGQIIKAEIGFDFLTIPENIQLLNEDVIQHNKIIIVNNGGKEAESKKNNSTPFSFDFFAGFPICTNDDIVVGTLCIMDIKAKELSPIQIKSLKQAVLQIQSLLKFQIQNKKLAATVREQENQFKLFIDNSREILFELNLEGIFTYISKNLINFLGYEGNEFIGNSITLFIHPEDMEMCISFLNNLIEKGKSENEITYRILHKDGYYVWHTTSLKLSEKDENLVFIGNCRDVTEYVEAQQKLLKQKEFYEKILDRIPTDVAVFDHNHRYIYLNPAAIKNDELRKFILGKDDFEYAAFTGRDNEFAKKRRVKYIEAIENKKVIEWEDTIQSENGEIIYHTRKFAPIFFEDGSFEMMVGFGIDITEEKINKYKILKSRQLTDSVIQNVAVGILVQGPQSEILENNKAACEMLGLTEDQLLGKTSFDVHWKVIHLDGSEFLSEEHPVPQAIKKMKPINNIVMGVHRPMHNDLVWLLVDAIPVFGDADELLYVICSFNDITAQKKAEDSLKTSNERFSYCSMATSDALWDWNMISDEIFVGENYKDLFGHQFENNIITGQECKNFVHPEDKEAYLESIDKCINSDIYRWSAEYRYLKSDGTYAYVIDKAFIVRDDAGKAIRIIGAMQDITKEKNLRDELQQSEEQFKGAFEYSAVGMAIVNLDGYWQEVNNRLCEILGYSKAEFKAMTFKDITYYEDLEENLRSKEKLTSREVSNFNTEKRYVHKNKSLVWVHLSVSIVRNILGEIQYFISQIIDISERKRIEEQNKFLTDEVNRKNNIKLDEAKNMYRLLADNTIDLVCLQNLDTTFTYVSPSIKKLLGYTPEDLTGKLLQDFIHPEDIKTLIDSSYLLNDGAEDITIRLRYRNIEGQYFWFECKAILIKENGIPIGFQCSSRDITNQKVAEELVENTLIQERELNELRTNLVSTISHEFRTPMTTIRTSAELISLYLESNNFENSMQIEKRVNTITEEIDRIIELMNAVLTISKEDSGKTNFNPATFDLKQLCLDVIDTSYNEHYAKGKVQASFDGDSFYIFADKNLMEYSIFNILNNAFKYSKGMEDIVLKVYKTPEAIVIEIIDFGIGIPEEDQPKLFNTFFRASNTDGFQGTGLGLYIVKTFVEKNSGTVALESQIGKGTKVTLQFPLQN